MEARLGLPTLLMRESHHFLYEFFAQRFQGCFIVWARCKWDNRVRGFILDKVIPISGSGSLLLHVKLVPTPGSERSVSSSDQEQGCSSCICNGLHFHGLCSCFT
jgi:hypothetical protein